MYDFNEIRKEAIDICRLFKSGHFAVYNKGYNLYIKIIKTAKHNSKEFKIANSFKTEIPNKSYYGKSNLHFSYIPDLNKHAFEFANKIRNI